MVARPIATLLMVTTFLLVGCKAVGPVERGPVPAFRVSRPTLTMEEQELRARNLTAFPDQTLQSAGPRTYAEIPISTGR